MPALEKARNGEIKQTAAGMSYLEMKYNLLMSYCTFLTFYLLLKVEGKPVENHPVVYKLTHIKTLFERLKPLDQKLQYQIDKQVRLAEARKEMGVTGALSTDKLGYKPNLKDLQMASDDEGDHDVDMYGMEGEEDGEDESDIDDDLRVVSNSKAMQDADDDSDEATPKGKKEGVYKAPKLTAVTYEDKADKKKRMKAEYEKRRLGKSNLLEELQREMRDEPEELHMGGVFGKKGKATRMEEAIENQEMEDFRRIRMSKKEQKKLRAQKFEDMQDKLETLDDDFAAI